MDLAGVLADTLASSPLHGCSWPVCNPVPGSIRLECRFALASASLALADSAENFLAGDGDYPRIAATNSQTPISRSRGWDGTLFLSYIQTPELPGFRTSRGLLFASLVKRDGERGNRACTKPFRISSKLASS